MPSRGSACETCAHAHAPLLLSWLVALNKGLRLQSSLFRPPVSKSSSGGGLSKVKRQRPSDP